MASYDDWKTRAPEDEAFQESRVVCEFCEEYAAHCRCSGEDRHEEPEPWDAERERAEDRCDERQDEYADDTASAR